MAQHTLIQVQVSYWTTLNDVCVSKTDNTVTQNTLSQISSLLACSASAACSRGLSKPKQHGINRKHRDGASSWKQGATGAGGPGRDPTGLELIHHKPDARQQLTTQIKTGFVFPTRQHYAPHSWPGSGRRSTVNASHLSHSIQAS